MEYINLIATHVKMLYYNKIDVSERIDINKSSKSKECMICHYWYFLGSHYKYKPEVCNACHHILMMAYELENNAILNAKSVDCRCVIWNMTRNGIINRLDNSKLDDKGSL